MAVLSALLLMDSASAGATAVLSAAAASLGPKAAKIDLLALLSLFVGAAAAGLCILVCGAVRHQFRPKHCGPLECCFTSTCCTGISVEKVAFLERSWPRSDDGNTLQGSSPPRKFKRTASGKGSSLMQSRGQ